MASRWDRNENRADGLGRSSNARRSHQRSLHPHCPKSHFCKTFFKTLQTLHSYEVLSGPDVNDGLVRWEGQEVPTRLKRLRELVKTPAREKRKCCMWCRGWISGIGEGCECQLLGVLWPCGAILGPVALLQTNATSGDLLQLLSIHLGSPWSIPSPMRLLLVSSLGEAIALLLQSCLELLVLLPSASLGSLFSHVQYRIDLVDLVLSEIQGFQLLDDVVLRGLFFVLFLGIKELVRSGGIVLGELILNKAGDSIRANVQPAQSSCYCIGILVLPRQKRHQVLLVLLIQPRTLPQHDCLELVRDDDAVGGCMRKISKSPHWVLGKSFVAATMGFYDGCLKGSSLLIIFSHACLVVDDLDDDFEIGWGGKNRLWEMLKVWLQLPAQGSQNLLGSFRHWDVGVLVPTLNGLNPKTSMRPAWPGRRVAELALVASVAPRSGLLPAGVSPRCGGPVMVASPWVIPPPAIPVPASSPWMITAGCWRSRLIHMWNWWSGRGRECCLLVHCHPLWSRRSRQGNRASLRSSVRSPMICTGLRRSWWCRGRILRRSARQWGGGCRRHVIGRSTCHVTCPRIICLQRIHLRHSVLIHSSILRVIISPPTLIGFPSILIPLTPSGILIRPAARIGRFMLWGLKGPWSTIHGSGYQLSAPITNKTCLCRLFR